MAQNSRPSCPALAEQIRQLQQQLGDDFARGVQVEVNEQDSRYYNVFIPDVGSAEQNQLLFDMMRGLYPNSEGEGVEGGAILTIPRDNVGPNAATAKNNILGTLRAADPEDLATRIGCRRAMADNVQVATTIAFTGNRMTSLDATLPKRDAILFRNV